MSLKDSLPFIRNYVYLLNEALKQNDPDKQLSRLQVYWLSFIILGILVTNTVCWQKISRSSIGTYSSSAISWMFKKGKISWNTLLYASTLKIIEKYGIRSGVLVIDDTDAERSKSTMKIAKVHKIKDKKTGGYFRGQNLVFLVLVTKKITIPVGFEFYEPDPAMKDWKKEDNRLKALKTPKKDRPKEPQRNPDYPGKKELAIRLLKNFVISFPQIRIKCVVADCFYGSASFIRETQKATGQNQVITQIRKNQLIMVKGIFVKVSDHFNSIDNPVVQEVELRGKEKTITYITGKFTVKSHEKKYFIIALKYDNEKEYRYILASDMSWNVLDTIKAYALRWLVEVFIQDWKSYEGWDQLAMQPGIDGANRSLTLSLLCDHVLFFHKDQLDLFKNGESAATVGSLKEKVMMESIIQFVQNIIDCENPKEQINAFNKQIEEVFQLRASMKHIRNTEFEF
jgi:hypothetical protein